MVFVLTNIIVAKYLKTPEGKKELKILEKEARKKLIKNIKEKDIF